MSGIIFVFLELRLYILLHVSIFKYVIGAFSLLF